MRRVILNADDFGYEPRVTAGIVEAMRRGVVSSTTMMVNTPSAEHAAPDAAGLAVGLHLNLARWSALSDGRTLSDTTAATLPVSFVEAETFAQLDHFEKLLGHHPTHLDVHKHLHLNANVLEGVARAAKARGLPVRSIDAGMRAELKAHGVATNDSFIGDAGSEPYWTLERFIFALDELPATGVVELMCHPGYAPTDFPSGYGAQREVELKTLTAPEAAQALKQRGIHLQGWGVP